MPTPAFGPLVGSQWITIFINDQLQETDGVLNVPLQHNIDPDEKNKRSYMLPRHFVGSKEHFQDPDKKFRIHKDDMDTVKKYKK